MQTSTSYTSLYSHDTDATASSFQVSHAAADPTVSHHGAGAREGVVYEENNASESLPSSEADMTASGHDVNRMELAEARRLFHNMDPWNPVRQKLAEVVNSYSSQEAQDKSNKMLSLSQCQLDNGADLAIAMTLLTSHPEITSLDLSRNSLGFRGGLVLAPRFEDGGLDHLEYLDLSYTNSNSTAAECILRALKKQRNLRTLILSGNNIGKRGAAMLSELIECSNSLEKLDLSYVHSFAAFGMSNLNSALKNSTKLRWLSLEGNDVGNSGVHTLSAAIKQNISLEVLNLDYNGITASGIRELARALHKHTQLKVLSIAETKLTDDSSSSDATSAVCCLLLNGLCPLRVLDMRRCSVRPDQYQALLGCLAMNNVIERVNLSQCEILSKSPKVHSRDSVPEKGAEDNRFDTLNQPCNSHRKAFEKRRAFPVRRKSTLEMIQRPEKRLSQMSLDTFQGPDVSENGIIRRIGLSTCIKSDPEVKQLMSRLTTLDTRVPIEKRELAQRWYREHEETLVSVAETHRQHILGDDLTTWDAERKTSRRIYLVLGNSSLRRHILELRGWLTPLSLEV
eukprot:gb/GECG01010895.1/.p1 GENE.gb/GECG01010895.1/~~gb/GECG01010895.1/.p1  ORF type:complete len:568 (+),score=63.78 gb/GECG01010895.1/:1-1704(+)